MSASANDATQGNQPARQQQQSEASESVAKAITDLATRLSLPLTDISVVRQEERTWRDGSMGCPRPGMMYTHALIEGSALVLSAKGREYHYHAGGSGNYFYCANPADDGSTAHPNQ